MVTKGGVLPNVCCIYWKTWTVVQRTPCCPPGQALQLLSHLSMSSRPSDTGGTPAACRSGVEMLVKLELCPTSRPTRLQSSTDGLLTEPCPLGRTALYRFQLTFRHRASCILGQAFHYSPENAFYIFNQQIYFIIWYLLDRASLI